MKVAPKKPIRLKNRTKFFVPDKDKAFVHFASPDSYQSRRIKIEGYESRLYWQFRYCQSIGGQTFYYTLTYADKNLPVKYGTPCFDYDDLRDLFTGGFRKQLLRKYGTTFKYFVGAELGEGAGKRGFRNNPHYHILFFLEPNPIKIKRRIVENVPVGVYKRNTKNHQKGDVKYGNVSRYEEIEVPYRLITPEEFRHLVRIYWQGFDQEDVVVSFKDARYGIAKEGENLGLVTDFRACMYCAKYVCKDVALVQNEENVIKCLSLKLRNEYRYKDSTYKAFWLDYKKNKPYRNTPDVRVFERYVPDAVVTYLRQNPDSVLDSMEGVSYQTFVVAMCKKFGLWHRFYDFLDSFIADKVKEGLNEWRNRFCNKCRISQGVGKCAIDTITDKNNPTIQVPDSKDGWKNRPIGMYYYRQMFCDVVMDKVNGNNLYVLNEDGKKYKLAKLEERLKSIRTKSYDYMKLLVGNEQLYNDMFYSDVNTEVTISWNRFKEVAFKLIDKFGYDEILKRYAEYKFVYQDRFFSYQVSRSADVSIFPCVDVRKDYERFLVPSFFSVDRNDLLLSDFLENTPENYLPYREHKYFLPFVSVFCVLDLCTDYFFVQGDNRKQKEAEKRADTKRFHDKLKLQQFYSNFK